MPITAILSLKGGTGKTTTALNLGASLALKGNRVMLVDLDPQASLSYALRFRREDVTPTLADVLLGSESVHDVIWKPDQENLYLCPSDVRLLELHRNAGGLKHATRRFAENLKSIKRKNSHVLIDCPPGMTALSVMAIQSADYYLVPTTATPMSIEALGAFLDFLDTSDRELGTQARLLGILLTQVNPYLRLSVDTIREVRAAYKKDVFSTVIRQSVRLAEAPASGQSIFEYAADSIGAENYNQLRKEFLHRIGA